MSRGDYKRHIAVCPHCRAIVEAKNLTYQQWEVAKRLIAGDPATKIAEDLFVSIKTIESHRLKIWDALGIKNVAQLIRWANDHGFLSIMGWDESRPASKE